MRRGFARFVRSAPAVLWAMGIWALSSTSSPPGTSWIDVPHLDKVVHAGLFFVQAVLLRVTGLAAPWAFLLAVAWGAIDEVHQTFVPGRNADVADWFADAFGALLGVTVSNMATLRAVTNDRSP